MAEVRYEQATRVYPGTDSPAVDALDLEIRDGEFVVLVGPSGCGKSTALRMLAGLEEVDAGSIFIGDRDVTDVTPKDRDVAMVFQNYALYPYMTVAANIGVPVADRGVPKAETRSARPRGRRDARPRATTRAQAGQLSGGQRQRVAMGRAIVREPGVPDGRAAVEPRREAARADARRASQRCRRGSARRPSTSPTTRSRR